MSDVVKKHLAKVLEQITSAQALERAGKMAIAFINKRVQAGIDLSGNPFKQYSARYAALKLGTTSGWQNKFQRAKTHTGRVRAQAGLSRASSGKVDLQLTGQMMRDIHTNIIRNEATSVFTIEVGYITGKSDAFSTRKAGYHNSQGAGRNKIKRTFVGLTDDETRQLFGFFRAK